MNDDLQERGIRFGGMEASPYGFVPAKRFTIQERFIETDSNCSVRWVNQSTFDNIAQAKAWLLGRIRRHADIPSYPHRLRIDCGGGLYVVYRNNEWVSMEVELI